MQNVGSIITVFTRTELNSGVCQENVTQNFHWNSCFFNNLHCYLWKDILHSTMTWHYNNNIAFQPVSAECCEQAAAVR